MNAAFLLMTTACLTGADAAAPGAPPPAAAPIHSVGTGGCAGGGCSSCGGGCDTCGSCGCESEGFLSKLKAKFHRSSDCGCETESRFSKFAGHMHQSSCGCDTGCSGGCGSPCDACGGRSGLGLREKLRGLFNRGGSCGCETSCGCDTGCAGGGCGGVVSPLPGSTMPKEQIGAPKEEPKKLPSGDTKPNPDKKPGSVQLIPQPVLAPSLELAPTGGKSPF